MSLLSSLQEMFQDVFGPGEPPSGEGRLTLAALLVLVSRIDGRVLEVEEEGLRMLLRSRFGVTEEGVSRILGQVSELTREVDEAASLAERIQHDVAPGERPRILSLAYRMAAIDGFLHEFEDDLIWRLGRLLGQSEADIAAIREKALRNLAPEGARGA